MIVVNFAIVFGVGNLAVEKRHTFLIKLDLRVSVAPFSNLNSSNLMNF